MQAWQSCIMYVCTCIVVNNGHVTLELMYLCPSILLSVHQEGIEREGGLMSHPATCQLVCWLRIINLERNEGVIQLTWACAVWVWSSVVSLVVHLWDVSEVPETKSMYSNWVLQIQVSKCKEIYVYCEQTCLLWSLVCTITAFEVSKSQHK